MVLSPEDLLVSLDVVSLFTRVPLKPKLKLLTPLLLEATIRLFQLILQSTYFTYDIVYYEHVDGVAMGLSLSPVIADLYIVAFEKQDLDQIPLKPSVDRRYVGDTLVV